MRLTNSAQQKRRIGFVSNLRQLEFLMHIQDKKQMLTLLLHVISNICNYICMSLASDVAQVNVPPNIFSFFLVSPHVHVGGCHTELMNRTNQDVHKGACGLMNRALDPRSKDLGFYSHCSLCIKVSGKLFIPCYLCLLSSNGYLVERES